jgi:hypothetical protein
MLKLNLERHRRPATYLSHKLGSTPFGYLPLAATAGDPMVAVALATGVLRNPLTEPVKRWVAVNPRWRSAPRRDSYATAGTQRRGLDSACWSQHYRYNSRR